MLAVYDRSIVDLAFFLGARYAVTELTVNLRISLIVRGPMLLVLENFFESWLPVRARGLTGWLTTGCVALRCVHLCC